MKTERKDETEKISFKRDQLPSSTIYLK